MCFICSDIAVILFHLDNAPMRGNAMSQRVFAGLEILSSFNPMAVSDGYGLVGIISAATALSD